MATLGPASSSARKIESLIKAGVNVFRLNFSHGDADTHRKNVDKIRKTAKKLGVIVGILQDLQGPKIRVGCFQEQQVELSEGSTFLLHSKADELGNQQAVSVSYAGLYKDVAAGDVILLDDGKMELTVEKVENQIVHTVVKRGGILSNNKGINLPDADLSLAAVTKKDIEDIAIGAELDVDWVALSFVRNRDDLLLAKHYLKLNESRAKLMAKIEKPGAIRNYKEILKTADGVMVARGDLGVEMSPEKVPMLQKKLIRKAREKGKPVVTATQMLESMIHSAVPTRAEANDVANAIFDGTDAVMLSAETAVGEYPVKAVSTMAKIARTVEADGDYKKRMEERKVTAEKNTPDAVCSAACQVALTLEVKTMCCFSSSGATALRVARNRIPTAVMAISPSIKSCQQLALSWGINPILSEDATNSEEMVEIAKKIIGQQKNIKRGTLFVITAGVPFGHSGTTNLIRVEQF